MEKGWNECPSMTGRAGEVSGAGGSRGSTSRDLGGSVGRYGWKEKEHSNAARQGAPPRPPTELSALSRADSSGVAPPFRVGAQGVQEG